MDKYGNLEIMKKLKDSGYLSLSEFLVLKNDILSKKGKYTDRIFNDFSKICRLLDIGAFTREEFDNEKKKIFLDNTFSDEILFILPKKIKNKNIDEIKNDIIFFNRVNDIHIEKKDMNDYHIPQIIDYLNEKQSKKEYYLETCGGNPSKFGKGYRYTPFTEENYKEFNEMLNTDYLKEIRELEEQEKMINSDLNIEYIKEKIGNVYYNELDKNHDFLLKIYELIL